MAMIRPSFTKASIFPLGHQESNNGPCREVRFQSIRTREDNGRGYRQATASTTCVIQKEDSPNLFEKGSVVGGLKSISV